MERPGNLHVNRQGAIAHVEFIFDGKLLTIYGRKLTTKWLTGAPQYAVRFHDWNTAPKIKPGQFVFRVPKGAKKLEAVLQ